MGRKISQCLCSLPHPGPKRPPQRGRPPPWRRAQVRRHLERFPAGRAQSRASAAATPTEKGRRDARRACVRARAGMAERDILDTEGPASGQAPRLRDAPQLQLGPGPRRRYSPPESPTPRQGPRGLSALRPAAWMALTFQRHGRAQCRLVRSHVPKPTSPCRRPPPPRSAPRLQLPRAVPALGTVRHRELQRAPRRHRFACRSGRGFGRPLLKERPPGEEGFPARQINPSDQKKKKKKNRRAKGGSRGDIASHLARVSAEVRRLGRMAAGASRPLIM